MTFDHDTLPLLSLVVRYLTSQGSFEETHQIAYRSAVAAESVYGVAAPETAVAIKNLAEVLVETGLVDAGIQLLERALAIEEHFLTADDTQIAVTLNLLGCAFVQISEHRTAKLLLERAQTIFAKQFGDDNCSNTVTGNLALIAEWEGNVEKASALYCKAFDWACEVYGVNDLRTAAIAMNYGDFLRRIRCLPEAEEFLLHAFRAYKISLKENHPSIAIALQNLALVMHDQEKYEDAIPLFEHALSIAEISLSLEHPLFATTITNLGVCYYLSGQIDLAEGLLLRAVELREASGYRQSAIPLVTLAQISAIQNDIPRARQMYLRAIEVIKNGDAPNSERLTIIQEELAALPNPNSAA